MTNQNKKRNFLAGALATASAATLMLGVSDVAFAQTTRTVNANNGAFSIIGNFSPAGPVVNGDEVTFAPGFNATMVDDLNNVNIMANLAGVNNAVLQVNEAGATTLFIGGVRNTGTSVATGLTIQMMTNQNTVTFGTNGQPNYGAPAVTPGDFSRLAVFDFNSKTATTVNIGTNNFNSGVKFTNTAADSILNINANTTGVVLSSDIGSASALSTLSIAALANSSTTFTGNIYSNGAGGIKLNAGSVIELKGNDYRVNFVRAVNTVAAGEGTLKFTNGGAVSLATTATAGNPINTVVVDGGTAVTLTGTDGIRFRTLSFTGTSGTPMLTLPNGQTIAAHAITNITSTRGANVPEVRFSGANQVIASTDTIGDATNRIKFRFMDAAAGRSFTVNTANFNAAIVTQADGVGDAILSAVNGKVYGLGEAGSSLRSVDFMQNTVNFGSTYAKNSTIWDNRTVELGDNIEGGVKLGTGAGNATLNLRDQVSLAGDITQDTGSTNNTVNFLGTANEIRNIGTAAERIANINFNGTLGSVAYFNANTAIYGKTINFKDTAIDATAGNLTIDGASAFNANIALGSSQVTFQGSPSTWGANTSISTNVNGNAAGLININTTIDMAANSNMSLTPVFVALPVVNLSTLNSSAQVIKVNAPGALNSNGSTFSIKNVQGVTNNYLLHSVTPVITNGVISSVDITTTYNGPQAVAQAFAAAGITDATDNANAQMLANATRGDALTFAVNTGALPSATGVEAFRRLTNTNTTQITSVIQALLFGSDNAIINRVSDTALQVDRNEIGKDAPSAAGCERVVGAPMGAWLTPIYSQATQKAKGGNAGYKVKSGGAIIGLDTEANDNMIIGAAATIVTSDMKMKDYKAGDKAKVNSFMFSLYGAQELVRDFFVQGVASFSTSKIKGKERRLVPTSMNANGYETARANYGSMGFSGQVLLGYNAKPVSGVFITPVAGVRYSKINDESYKETGTTNQNNSVSKKSVNKVDAVFGIQVESNVQKRDGAFVPEAHAYITRKLSGKTGKVNATLDGLTTSFVTRHDTTSKTLYNVGLGAKVMSGQMEYGAGYDAYFASKYIAHQGSLKVRVNF